MVGLTKDIITPVGMSINGQRVGVVRCEHDQRIAGVSHVVRRPHSLFQSQRFVYGRPRPASMMAHVYVATFDLVQVKVKMMITTELTTTLNKLPWSERTIVIVV